MISQDCNGIEPSHGIEASTNHLQSDCIKEIDSSKCGGVGNSSIKYAQGIVGLTINLNPINKNGHCVSGIDILLDCIACELTILNDFSITAQGGASFNMNKINRGCV